jgi:hypothetical protein
MMPIAWEKSGSNLKNVAYCDECGQLALYGESVRLRSAIATKDASKAGKWFCGWVDGAPACVAAGAVQPSSGKQEAA